MRYTFGAGRYFDIPVRIHITFPLILVLFGANAWRNGTWSDGLRAVVLVLAVFVCVVLHEFGHSLQIKRYGIKVRDIILLPIGGMARAERIPENPWQEIVVAISGPVVNFAIALITFAVLWLRGEHILASDGFLTSLFLINIVLGLFNLVPAFPMDGGRILRGLLALRLPYLRATGIARSVGQVIALGFAIIGFMNSSFIMLPVIAVFIFFGGAGEEQMIRVRIELDDKRVRDLVSADNQPLLMTESVAEAGSALAGTGAGVVAITDISRTVTGVAYARDVSTCLANGQQDYPLGGLARFDFPILSAEMPALQAYYFLKSEKRTFAGVIDGGIYLGIVHFDSFLDGGKRAS